MFKSFHTSPSLRGLAVLALGVAACVGAQAQGKPLRGFIGMGVTGGGETLTTVQWADGGSAKIKSGGLIDFRAGMDYQLPNSPVSLQASVGYHFDRVNASNGNVQFVRFPFEALAYFQAAPNLRLGGGLRYINSAKLSGLTLDGTVTLTLGSVGSTATISAAVTTTDLGALSTEINKVTGTTGISATVSGVTGILGGLL